MFAILPDSQSRTGKSMLAYRLGGSWISQKRALVPLPRMIHRTGANHVETERRELTLGVAWPGKKWRLAPAIAYF